MMDIKEVPSEFQKLNKTENCIVIQLKSEQKVAITSPVSILYISLVSVQLEIWCLVTMRIDTCALLQVSILMATVSCG